MQVGNLENTCLISFILDILQLVNILVQSPAVNVIGRVKVTQAYTVLSDRRHCMMR